MEESLHFLGSASLLACVAVATDDAVRAFGLAHRSGSYHCQCATERGIAGVASAAYVEAAGTVKFLAGCQYGPSRLGVDG